MITRRAFIKNSALLTAGATASPKLLFNKPVNKIGLQIYTVRNVISKDVPGTISKIASIGFNELEIGAYSKKEKFYGMEPKQFKQLLDIHELTAPSSHIGFDLIYEDKKKDKLKYAIDAAIAMGNKYTALAYSEERYRKTIDDYKLMAEKLNTAGILCKNAGIQLAYHNHDFEFNKLENGRTGYDVLLHDTDKELVQLELDLYWASKAGQDPVAIIKNNPGRIVMWHVKDMDKITKNFVEVGTGSIDFKRIFAQEELSGLKHFFIEQDEVSKDVFESIRQSYNYVKKSLL